MTTNFPFLSLNNRKKETSNENPSSKIPLGIKSITSNIQSQPSPDIKNIKSQLNKDQPKEESHHSQKEEEDNKDNEYTLCLKTALNEAISENDFLRNELRRLKKANEELTKELTEKESAIVELANYYEYCQEHHQQKEEDSEKQRKQSL